ncbi:hypothetical protein [Vibrio parahaemolyticus]|uniref:hypothetical protein n=1 Tax=Vibrio parahaemolyticus TaxID=670 RepID=UPI00320E0357
MDKKSLFKLYRELYFHEMDVKEKLVARTQISFAVVVTAFTVISYMIRMLDYNSNCYAVAFFVVFVSISTLILIASLWFLIHSFSWRSYRGIPSPSKTDNYRIELIEHRDALVAYNEENPEHQQELYDVDEVMESYLYENFKVCSTHNTEVNDGRSGYARDGFKWVLTALLPLAIASSIFIIADLDTSSPRKELLIKDSNVTAQLEKFTAQVELLKLEASKFQKESIMSDEKNVAPPPPPPMPTAPEPRNIKSETPVPPKEM